MPACLKKFVMKAVSLPTYVNVANLDLDRGVYCVYLSLLGFVLPDRE
jgi:hypothetical protein